MSRDSVQHPGAAQHPEVVWRSRQGLAIGLILLSSLSFSILDTATKYTMAFAPAVMLLWFRCTFQAAITLALRWPVQGRSILKTAHPRFQLLRGALMLTSTACAFVSLQHIPVGEFTAMVMLSPLVATALAAWLLKAQVSRLRWLLLFTGLLGVLLVIRPGGQIFSWVLFFPGLLILANAGFQVLTSRLSGQDSPYSTHFYSGLVGTLLVSPLAWLHWDGQALLTHWPWFLGVGVLGAFGHLMLVRAYQYAAAPVLMPYIYAQIGFSMLLGWWVFSHMPDPLAWLGIAVIACSGVANATLAGYSPKTTRHGAAV